MNAYFVIISLIGAAMCLGLGLLILSRNPRHSSNIGFTLGIFNLIVITVGNALIMFPSGGLALNKPWHKLSLIGQSFLPAAWLNLRAVILVRF